MPENKIQPLSRRILHWLTAILVFALIAIGFRMTGSPIDTPENIDIAMWRFSLHKSLGTIVLVLTLIRFVLMFKAPLFHFRHNRFETFAATFAHAYLLSALIFLPVTGLLQHSLLEGAAPIWTLPGGGWHAAEPDPALAEKFGAAHHTMALTLILVLLAHIAGALKHHFFDRNETLRAMTRGVVAPQGQAVPDKSSFKTIASLLGVLTLMTVGILGGLAGHSERPKISFVTSVPSDWKMLPDQSELKIEAVQGANAFTASFERFETAISLDPKALDKARIEVIIDASSFKSGLPNRDNTVAGVDWMDVPAHPTATWRSTSVTALGENRYLAEGDLTIRGVSLSVPLNFTLVIDGDKASAEGSAAFDRMKINLGRGQTGALSSAGKDIKVIFTINAVRNVPEQF